MILLVVESPTKAKTLSRFLGEKYEVVATRGHIKDLPKSKLGVDVEDHFKPNYEVVPKQSAQIKALLSQVKKSKHVYLATDPDREGEAISAHVAELVKERMAKKTVPMDRVVFHEITQLAVEDAIAHPRSVDENLVDAQIARRVLDRLVGYKLSPLLWKKVRRGLSAGRVQTVAVKLIVEKEKEIAAFKPVEYWDIRANLSQKGKSEIFIAYLDKENGKKVKAGNAADAKKIVSSLENSEFIVESVSKRTLSKRPYPPFTTSTMTQAAARMFGWSAKRTMSVAQKLYEEGVITYHRTDSFNLSAQAISQARDHIGSKYGKNYIPESPRYYKKQSKLAQEAHEAIRPTDVNKVSGLTGMEEKLYQLILKRFLACQMVDAIFDETSINILAGAYLFKTGGQVMKFDGWRKVIPTADKDEVIIPDLTEDEKLDLKKITSDQKFTEPPPRFNEASIIKTMEKLGIGRPSTYAPTISTIQARGYVEKTEGKFFATPVGVAVVDFLTQNFPDVFENGFTAGMEDTLDEIAQGKKKWQGEMGSFWKPFSKKLADVEEKSKRVKIEVEKLDRECPECKQGSLVIRFGRFGKFISCERFPECKYTEKYMEKIDMKCPECGDGDVVVKKTAKKRVFYGCSRYPDCKFASWKKPGKAGKTADEEVKKTE